VFSLHQTQLPFFSKQNPSSPQALSVSGLGGRTRGSLAQVARIFSFSAEK
jgi:hypothetical protein